METHGRVSSIIAKIQTTQHGKLSACGEPGTLFGMKRTLGIALALLLCLSTGFAQDWAKQKLDKSPRHGEWVPVKHDDRTVQAYVVYPETKQKVPVIIVIHEIFGLSDWARSVADDLAAHGYIAIAPDLLSGMGPNIRAT